MTSYETDRREQRRREIEGLADRLQNRCEGIACRLLGEPTKSKTYELRWYGQSGDRGGIKLCRDGRDGGGQSKRGRWADYSGNLTYPGSKPGKDGSVGGGMLELIMAARGMQFADAIKYGYELIGENPPEHAPRKAPAPKNDDASRRAYALRIWNESRDLKGTPAELYLRKTRGLELPDDVSGRVLRYHPACPFDSQKVPALVALFTSLRITSPDRWPDGEPLAIHRTALTADGRKAFAESKKMLGPVDDGAIKLAADANVTTGLTIGEGIETTLAGIVMGFAPAWALGAAGRIAAFPVLPGVECLRVIVDNDPEKNGRRAGPEAALSVSKRWTSAGREVIRTTTSVAKDLADLVRAA
jgi:hypothetical protein